MGLPSPLYISGQGMGLPIPRLGVEAWVHLPQHIEALAGVAGHNIKGSRHGLVCPRRCRTKKKVPGWEPPSAAPGWPSGGLRGSLDRFGPGMGWGGAGLEPIASTPT